MKKIKHSFATKKRKDGTYITDPKAIAKKLINWGEIPKNINDTRAMELSILARTFLEYDKRLREI